MPYLDIISMVLFADVNLHLTFYPIASNVWCFLQISFFSSII